MRDAFCDGPAVARLAAQAAHDGRVPLWNSWSLFGQPFVANSQSAVFYPPHLLFDVLARGARVPPEHGRAPPGRRGRDVRPPAADARERRRGGAVGVTFAFGTYFSRTSSS